MLTSEQKQFLISAAQSAVKAETRSGVAATMVLAQLILESAWGKKIVGANGMGIKAYAGCYGVQELPTWEVLDGKRVEVLQKFATFPDLESCLAKHGELITTGFPYRKAWKQYQADKQFEPFVRSVSKVYATDPAYADKLIRIMAMPEVKAALLLA